MPGRGDRHRVVLFPVQEHRPLVEDPPEAAGELPVEAGEVIGPELVDRDEHDEPGPGARGRERCNGRRRGERREQQDGREHRVSYIEAEDDGKGPPANDERPLG